MGQEGSCISGRVIREILSEDSRDKLITEEWKGCSQVNIWGKSF